eukprot:1342956-Amorphochlora_amoeboformis.AAC.1
MNPNYISNPHNHSDPERILHPVFCPKVQRFRQGLISKPGEKSTSFHMHMHWRTIGKLILVLKKSGMDAAVYLRFVRMCVTATFILTEVYEETPHRAYSRCPDNILMSLGYFLYCYSCQYSRTGGKIAHYTVMITQIPDHFDTEAKIRDFMEPQYPDSISHVEPVIWVWGVVGLWVGEGTEECYQVHDLSVLDTKIKELQSGEVALMKVKTKSETRSLEDGPLMTRNKCGGCCGDEVEAVKYYTEKVENLKKVGEHGKWRRTGIL